MVVWLRGRGGLVERGKQHRGKTCDLWSLFLHPCQPQVLLLLGRVGPRGRGPSKLGVGPKAPLGNLLLGPKAPLGDLLLGPKAPLGDLLLGTAIAARKLGKGRRVQEQFVAMEQREALWLLDGE